MPEDDKECKSFTVIFIDSLLVYENKYYLKAYLVNCTYKIVNKQMIMIEFEEIDTTNINRSKKCYWFFQYGFKFQNSVCNDCHDLTFLCLNISNIATSLLKMLIIIALFITLTNLKQLSF